MKFWQSMILIGLFGLNGSAKGAEVVHAPVPSSHEKKDSVSPDQALGWLKNGNTRFRKGFLRADGQSTKDIQRLSSGQSPHTIVISCSDSRVPPEIIFDQKLGELFVVRTAGEAIDSSALASVEYAVEHLGAKNIIVLGHTECGAVKAAVATLDGKDAGSENLNKLVADIHPRIRELAKTQARQPSSHYESEGWANARGVASDLGKRSKIISHASSKGDVKISSAIYHLDSGQVDFEPSSEATPKH